MPIKRINEFPEGSGSLSTDDVFLFMDDPSGSGITKKISLSDISSAIGGGGNPFDQNLNTTDFPTFSGINLSNFTTLAQGTFDNGTGGGNGISLNCYVGYELNWQGGHLISTQDSGVSAATIQFDSPIAFNAGTSPAVYGQSIDGSYTTDARIADIIDLELEGPLTLENPINPVNGKTLRWRITQDSVGDRTVTLGSQFNIPSSASSPLPWSTDPNKTDILAATYHAGRDKWDVVAFVMGY